MADEPVEKIKDEPFPSEKISAEQEYFDAIQEKQTAFQQALEQSRLAQPEGRATLLRAVVAAGKKEAAALSKCK